MDGTSTGSGTRKPEVDAGNRELEVDFLWGLQKFLAGRVASLRIVTPERGAVYLEVVAKGPGKRSTDVWVAPADGVWWFWWGVPWSQRFGRADDPERAAETVLIGLGDEH